MRENIGLFRGKRIDNGEWVEGYLVKFILNPIQEWWEISTGKSTEYGATERYRVDPDTIGECTSMKDKNGKLIFEGDIVLNANGGKFVVTYGKHDLWCCGCCFDSHQSVGFYLDEEGCPLSDDEAWCGLEIIGNFHDNPELLKN